jgi:hypothetical protein
MPYIFGQMFCHISGFRLLPKRIGLLYAWQGEKVLVCVVDIIPYNNIHTKCVKFSE